MPTIPLLGLALLGFPSENASKPMPYKTEKALLPEPVFHPATMSITPILNMSQVAITLGYRYLLISDEKEGIGKGVVVFSLRKPTVD